jgi:dethiobiotin synthetase
VNKSLSPTAGDLLLARVDAIGFHTGLQLPEGRRKTLFVGDEIVVVYGNRYAPSQFEAVVPKTLGPCQLVASGGVAGKVLSGHAKASKGATQITPIGLLTDATGKPTNLRDYALESVDQVVSPCPATVAVVGTAMDSGKTQTAAYLVRGLTLAGLNVGYAKVTGTGAGGDTWLLHDAGAHPVIDFTDAGLVSTYLISSDELQRVFATLVTHVARAGVDVIVLEVADGLLQKETADLLGSDLFRDVVGGVLFASADAMGALAGYTLLQSLNLPILGLAGVLTASPLQCEESLKVTGLEIFSRTALAQPKTAVKILGQIERPGVVLPPGARLDRSPAA